MTSKLNGSLLLVGAGKMGGAMLAGWLDQGLAPQSIIIRDPAPASDVIQLVGAHGIRHTDAPLDEPPSAAVIAVKPQMMDVVLPSVAPDLGRETLVISVAAGRTMESMARHLGHDVSLIRVMPNTPAAVGRAISVACPNAQVTATQKATCSSLLNAIGDVQWIEDETLLDAVTAVSGSGPAYVFWLTECLAKAGIVAGLDEDLAMTLARQTVAGAGELLYQADESAEMLRRNVTSPGGTTAAALDVLMADDGLERLMARAIEAAARRSRELAD